jgi:hypothetical protein
MIEGIDRTVDLIGARSSALSARASRTSSRRFAAATRRAAATDGHFAAIARDGRTVRLARTIGIPLRYFVAKMYHGPFLVVSDRIDRIFDWCQSQRIGLAVRSATRAWCRRTTWSSSIRSAAPIRRPAIIGFSIRQLPAARRTSMRPARHMSVPRWTPCAGGSHTCRLTSNCGGVFGRDRQHRHAAAGASRVSGDRS